jgi:hypothetical protein
VGGVEKASAREPVVHAMLRYALGGDLNAMCQHR